MEDELYFSELVTKSLHPVQGEGRFFEGYLTVQVKDKQGEITIVDELIKVLPIWMDRGAPISDTHSNRIIGKGISYSKDIYKSTDGAEYPCIKIIGKIHSNYELDNEIWKKIKSGEYKGLSFGGATKSNRTPKIMKDGSVAYELKNLEHYEVAVCKDPAVPLAVITDFNPIAKAMAGNSEDRDGKMVIKCTKFGCYIGKADLSEADTFEEKVQKLIAEGKTREQAEKIVGSFVKKEDIEKAEENQHGAWGQRGLGDGNGTGAKQGSGDTHTITEVKEDEEGKEGQQDAENDGNNHSRHSQDVDEDKSSGRKIKSHNDNSDQNVGEDREKQIKDYSEKVDQFDKDATKLLADAKSKKIKETTKAIVKRQLDLLKSLI